MCKCNPKIKTPYCGRQFCFPPRTLTGNPMIEKELKDIADDIKPEELMTIEVKNSKGEVIETLTGLHGAVICYLTPDRIRQGIMVGMKINGHPFTTGMAMSAILRSKDTLMNSHSEWEKAEKLMSLLLDDGEGGGVVAMRKTHE